MVRPSGYGRGKVLPRLTREATRRMIPTSHRRRRHPYSTSRPRSCRARTGRRTCRGLDQDAIASIAVDPPTVMTAPTLAGETWQASAPLLPAEATTATPALMTLATAWFSAADNG